MCLTVVPRSICLGTRLCTSRHVKKGPPPLDLPHFADVLAQVRWGCRVVTDRHAPGVVVVELAICVVLPKLATPHVM